MECNVNAMRWDGMERQERAEAKVVGSGMARSAMTMQVTRTNSRERMESSSMKGGVALSSVWSVLLNWMR